MSNNPIEIKDESLQPVLVRVVEWKEWLPGEVNELGEVPHPHPNAPPGTMVKKNVTLHRGISGFKTAENESLVELSVTGSGESKEVTYKNDDGEEETVIYGLYLFQAILAQNNVDYTEALNLQSQVQESLEEKAEAFKQEKGRDRREDLIIVENGKGAVPPPPPPNRAARRKKR